MDVAVRRLKPGEVPDPFRRLMESAVIGWCSEDAQGPLSAFVREVLEVGTWDPPVPDDWSLFVTGGSGTDGFVEVRFYVPGDPERAASLADMIGWEIERHPDAQRVWVFDSAWGHPVADG